MEQSPDPYSHPSRSEHRPSRHDRGHRGRRAAEGSRHPRPGSHGRHPARHMAHIHHQHSSSGGHGHHHRSSHSRHTQPGTGHLGVGQIRYASHVPAKHTTRHPRTGTSHRQRTGAAIPIQLVENIHFFGVTSPITRIHPPPSPHTPPVHVPFR
jgi:hypothetical protein